MEHIVIIGAVAAGTKAAAKAKRENPDIKITIFTNEEHISYSACGLPFFVGGEFKDYHQLVEYTKEQFEEDMGASVYTLHECIGIHPQINSVTIKNLQTGEIFEQDYDKLLLATGARPFIPPIEGKELKNVFKIRNLNDAFAIMEAMKTAKKAVIVGGGYIGVEMLEAFIKQGLTGKIVEKQPYIMPLLDEDVSINLKEMMTDKCPDCLVTSESVKRFIGENGVLKQVELESGTILDTDIALIAVGVRPNSEIAKEAGIEIGVAGAIKVDKHMRTSIPNIYAAGDCAEKTNIVSNKPVWVPLGSTANKEGRVAGTVLAGKESEFEGILGSAITKFFDIKIAITGLTEKEAKNLGYDAASVIIHSKDKAGYMQDSEPICIKMIADKKTKKLLGAEGVGYGDIDKRINIIASALSGKMTVKEYMNIDITYAPPFSRAIDITTTAAYQLDKILENQS
jgi:NADPH-dependent 2,4-dienoyl-CoA reductase/sulfur reductase-like enzyme